MDLRVCLERLSNAVGVGGLTQAADVAGELLTPYCDTVERDALGNVIGWMRSTKPREGDERLPVVMLEAHLDEIGLIVTGIDDDGFVRVSKCGGIDRRTLDAAEVVVWGDKPYAGVFCSTPPHLQKSGDKNLLCEIPDIGVDVGLDKDEAKAHIHQGDRVSFRPNFRVLNENRVCGKSLDDRAGVASVLVCMEQLQQDKAALPCDVAVVFAVQEELGGRGSTVSSFRVMPDAAIAVDVSFAYTPDAIRAKCGDLGKGPMIGWAPTLDDAMTRQLVSLAKDNAIPFHHEVMGGDTGTDADCIADARTGVRTALLSVPLRYMHTPCELIDVRDVEAVGRLMAAFVKKGAVDRV